MATEELNESATTGTSTSDSENETQTPEKSTTDYEKQRQSRIADNKARMEALGLRNLAISLMGSSENRRKRKRKPQSKRVAVKDEEDDEYCPNDEEEDDQEEDSGGGFSSSDEEFEVDNGNSRRSGKVKGRKSKSSKNIPTQKSMDMADFIDEDEALKQAIALSLKEFRELSDKQHFGSSKGLNVEAASVNDKEENTRRRKRKLVSSRVQMTADDLIIHFCQFDEVGKGSVTLRDLQRMASIHDFTWTDKKLADMIRCFDIDNDGKLTLDDFRTIAKRCNMLQGLENP